MEGCDYSIPEESTILRDDSIKSSSMLRLADILTHNILLHPFIALRRTCQVNRRCSPFICVQPFSLVPFLYHQQRKQGIAALYRGLSSELLVKGIRLGAETAIINYTDWPREVSQKRLFRDSLRVLALRGLSVAISTPFLCSAVKETIQSVIVVRDRPSFVDCLKDGFLRLIHLRSIPSARMLPIWLLIVPTVIYHVSHSAIWHSVTICLEALRSNSMFGRSSKSKVIKRTVKSDVRAGPSAINDSSWLHEELTYGVTDASMDVDKIDIDNNQISNSIIASLIADVALLPVETVLNSLYIQGTRTIIDNVDETTVVLPVLTNFDGFSDCYQSILKFEGNIGFYKGLGAVILQYSAHYLAFRILYYLLKEFQGNSYPFTSSRPRRPLKPPTSEYKRSLRNNRHSTPSNPTEIKPHIDSMMLMDTIADGEREPNFDFLQHQIEMSLHDKMYDELNGQIQPGLSPRPSECSEDQDLEARRQQIKENSKFLRGKFKSDLKEFITLKNIINTAFILNICFICFHQCYLQIYEYLEFKTRIQVMHKSPSNSVYLVPGITICNNNRLRLNKLAEKFPSTRVDVEKILNETTVASLTARKKIEIMQSIRSAIDEHIDISSMIIKTPISELLKMSASPMIEDINCNTSWGEQINCENLRVVESFQGGPCYTAFYLGSLLEALSNGKAYDFQSSLLKKGKRKLTSFDSHEVAEVLINFDPLNHGDIHQDIGGKMSIHSTGHVGSIRDVAHTILPGFKYEVIIQRYMSKRLPPPYESMCHDYKKINSPKFLTSQDHSWSTELDKTTCTRNCIIKLTTKSCNCWPVEIPYFPGDDTIVENAGSYRMCEWGFDEANMGNFSSKLYVDCYRKFHAECRAKCKHGCRTEDYRVHIVSNSWPGRDKFLVASSSEERKELMRLRGCCAVISIKYSELYEKHHIMIPNMTLAQMVSNIGGIVSALVGVSTITIYRHLTRRFFHCKIVNDRVPADILAPQGRRVNNRMGQETDINNGQ